jgi:AcrR family transcriptional regulator
VSRRNEIVRRAAELFDRQGVANTSIEDIARAVGIKREGIYYYFKSREEIVLEIILPQSQALLFNLTTILRSNMDSLEQLRAALRNHLSSYNPGYLEMSIALREDHLYRQSKRLRELRGIWKTYGDAWKRLVVGGQESGAFDRSIDPKIAAFGILGMCNWVSRWYDRGGPLDLEAITDTFYRMISSGLSRGDPTSLKAPTRLRTARRRAA